MKVGIDARMYGVAQRGIGRYLMKLIEALEKVDLQNEYAIFLRSQNFDEYQPKNPHFIKTLWNAPWYGWREQLQFRIPHSAFHTELFHFPHWNVPLLFNRPFVVTIHDLELFSSNRTREATTRGRLTYAIKFRMFKLVFRHAISAACAIIVPSNAVKEQLLDRYPHARSKVHVIYEAPAIEKLASRKLEARDRSNPKLLAPSSYVLYVGAAYPHKNLERLLRAWRIVNNELPDHKLVLVGRHDFFWQKLKLGIGDWGLGIKDSIVFHGEASDDDLAALYRHASLLVQPSLEEGFSLSPLEAISLGCPSAVSDIPVHREILGNAALFFDPYREASMAAAVKECLLSTRMRDRLLHYGKSVILRYSWRRAATQTLQLYEAMLR